MPQRGSSTRGEWSPEPWHTSTGRSLWRARLRSFVLVGAAAVGGFALLGGGFTMVLIPEVEVRNDLDTSVRLEGCDDGIVLSLEPSGFDQTHLSVGDTARIRPDAPCRVWDGPSRYVGCLRIPDEAFAQGETVLLSSMDPEIPYDDCSQQGYYGWRSPIGRGIRAAVHLFR